MEAIQVASVSDTLRVRLLSTAHARHAPSIDNAGHNAVKWISSGQLRIAAPARMTAIPSAMRQSKFSLNANQARSAVNTPSAFNRSEAPDAGVRVSPSISNTRADHAPCRYRAREPPDLGFRQSHRRRADQPTTERESQSRAEIQQPGQQPRIDSP